ncbi:MAG: hypothetical protein H7263_09780 [Candidatus Sericytochromatia bacterium]|nr:hypothetical protein [Candidatus Sericytochromatia bacterium]
MIIDYQLNQYEKEIFNNFFLKESSQGKKYRTWIDNFLNSYGLKIEKDQNKYSVKHQFNLMWNPNTHLIQYILKQERPLVPTRFKYILKLNSDLNITDESGNNLLHLSSEKKVHHWILAFFLNHHNYDAYQTNKDIHTYHTLFVEKFDNNLLCKVPKQNSEDFIHLIQDTHILFHVLKQFNDYLIKDYITHTAFDKFIKNCDTILHYLNLFQEKVNSPTSGLIKDSYLEETQNFEKTLNYIKLSKYLKETKSQKLPKI